MDSELANALQLFLTQVNQQNIATQKILKVVASLYDLTLMERTKALQNAHPNPLNSFGKKCFSQTDEDGITLEITRRIGIKNGLFAEFGVGDGLENNSIILAAMGWKGLWVGNQKLAINISESKRVTYINDWVTLENVESQLKIGLEQYNTESYDVISVDLDGNDYHFVEKILECAHRPKLFIVEYNAKFPPPVEFVIDYNPDHNWVSDDYFGASITSFNNLFNQNDYQLICCNAQTGGNSFFIDRKYSRLFLDVPKNIEDIWVSPRYFIYNKHGHKSSAKTIEQIINRA